MKRKLVFKKQTLHALAGEDLQEVYGGHWGRSGGSKSSPSGCNTCGLTQHDYCTITCHASCDTECFNA
ncbi:MAG: hypothetical protein IPL79_03505 [Myxococcales bacterium]|nr:hypothetical protein [Myxococcales bacterium]